MADKLPTPYEQLRDWLTPAEVAEYLEVSTWTVYHAIHNGELPYRRIGPKKIFIHKSEFDPSRAVRQVTVRPELAGVSL